MVSGYEVFILSLVPGIYYLGWRCIKKYFAAPADNRHAPLIVDLKHFQDRLEQVEEVLDLVKMRFNIGSK